MIKTRIYYLTRSYYPYQKGGGPLMRTGAVKYLKELGWDVIVVMPNYNSDDIKNEYNLVQIPFKNSLKWCYSFERVGIYEDYLDPWVKDAFDYLKDKVTNNDIVFATSGGELGNIKMGSLLKNRTLCKFVVNFRDPLSYSLVNGMKISKKFHVSREKQEKKYLSNADLILTSSNYYADVLKNKYPMRKDKIKVNYFGYIDKIDIIEKKKYYKTKKCINIAYVGTMSDLQKPELLYKLYMMLDENIQKNVKIYYIGDRSKYKPLKNIDLNDVEFIDYMEHDKFMNFMKEYIDVGFVSLTSDYLGACVPSKIYEYINLGLPILGALPIGDGKDIVNQNNYGIACKYDDLDSLVSSLEQIVKVENLQKFKNNILKDRDRWHMKNTIKEVHDLLGEL